jgi:hypothetical protein
MVECLAGLDKGVVRIGRNRIYIITSELMGN